MLQCVIEVFKTGMCDGQLSGVGSAERLDRVRTDNGHERFLGCCSKCLCSIIIVALVVIVILVIIVMLLNCPGTN